METTVIEVWDGEWPTYKGTSFSVVTDDIVVITQWRESWRSYHECCMFWRGPHSPNWRCIPQSSLKDELSTPLGWVRAFPQFMELFEPLDKYSLAEV